MNWQCVMKPKDLPNPRSEPYSLGDWLNTARFQLKQHPEEPFSSLYALVAYVLDQPSHFGISHPEYLLSMEDRQHLDHLLTGLLAGMPLPYLTGKQEFFNLDFTITPDVLIPRPETELLVSLAIDWLKAHPGKRRSLDVGTGSGCIAVSVCANVQDAQFVGIDKSYKALQIAIKNIRKFQLSERIHLVQMDLLRGISGRVDCLCANLPYIPTERLSELNVSRQEPLPALDGGENGLELIEELLRQSFGIISPSGVIFLEIDYSQAAEITAFSSTRFPNSFVKIEHDLAGLPRVAVIELN
jgi:release factor glutamine methyltransferase